MGNFIDLTGQKFGRLTVIERSENNNENKAMWLCRCDCGNTIITKGKFLRQGNVKSCGCLKKEQASRVHKTHGMSNTRLFYIWQGMLQRCYYPKSESYKYYGERGITVCDEWRNSFETFYKWAKNGYKEGLTLDRINVNDNYEPSNCRWVTQKEQSNNTRRNHLITYNGKTQTLAQWADELNKSYHTISSRINKLHWSIEKAFTTK